MQGRNARKLPKFNDTISVMHVRKKLSVYAAALVGQNKT